jgi:23S rRNA (adenine2503-C2)-methyltransferase
MVELVEAVAPVEMLESELDESVNFVQEAEPGKIEARYVRRRDDYFIVYLSSQTGCQKACRMCHLTQSGQTDARDVTFAEYFVQADEVLDHYDSLARPAEVVHFNFMSRGEVFANAYVLAGLDPLLAGLAERAVSRDLLPRFKLSTIMPQELADVELHRLFPRHNPDLYYSIYSTRPEFRRRWLPKALPVDLALAKLRRYQETTRKIPVLHWAFIAGENDSVADVEGICAAVTAARLRVDVNIVRYNPFSASQGQEPAVEVISRNVELLAAGLPEARIKVIDRVGFDVKASCGMFVGGRERKDQALPLAL